MEAKNTVMTTKQTVECSHNPVLELRERDICLAQAEISFKAGYEEGVKVDTRVIQTVDPDAWLTGRRAGIREVVEWIDKTFNGDITIDQMMATNTWQAKLKEWGIE